MSDSSHNENANRIEVAGYVACKNQWCADLVIKEVAQRTGGFCSVCWQKEFEENVSHLEVVARSSREPRRTSINASRRQRPNKGVRGNQKMVERAKSRALTRLKNLFPDLYDIFLAEERAKVGLDPWPIEMAIRGKHDVDGSETLEFARMYHLLEQLGVEVDGTSHKRKTQHPKQP